MKRVFLAVTFAAFAHSAFAGLTYKVDSASTGFRDSMTSGVAEVEGKNFRFNVTKGDAAIFPDSSFVISQNGGRTLVVADPGTKTYYELSLDQISGGAGAILQQMGGMVKFDIVNPKVSVRDLGAGEKIEGYATTHKNMDTSYDMSLDVMGQKMTIGMSMSTESWVTDQIPLDFASFLQTADLHTGFDAIDKLIAAQTKGLSGFPLKQVASIHIVQNGATMDMKTTTTISGIEKKSFPASEFAVPDGFRKTENPIDKMMKAMGGMKQ